jgi:hypothetical protein
MSITPSGGWFVVKNPQFVEEATYGIFPTNPAMNWIGAVDNFDLKADMQSIMFPQVGTEDLKYILKGAEVYTMDLEFGLQTSTFAKYGISSQGGGAGTIDKSLSILFSAKLNAVENYVELLGSRIGSFTISSQAGQLTKAKCQLQTKAIPIPFPSSPIGSGSFASDPATNPWTFYDGGSNPVTINSGSPVNPDVREFSVTFERNLERLHVLGQSQQKFLPPKQRRITGNFTIVWEDVNQYTNLTADLPATITWVLKFGTSTLTLSGCKIHKLDDFKFSPTEVVYEKYGFSALTASIT